MALANKKYTAVHDLTGSDKDLLKDEFDAGYLAKIADTPYKDPAMTALVYQMGLIQEELDELRRHLTDDVVGQTGATGPQGPAGADGAAGAKGDKGDKGDTGAAGTTDASQLDASKLPTSKPKTKNLLYNDKGIVKVS